MKGEYKMQDKFAKNKILVGGYVDSAPEFSHRVHGEGFLSFNIQVPRLSEKADVIPITISERLINLEEIFIGRKIIVEGQIRSYNFFVEEENKNKLVISVFATEIELCREDEKINNINRVVIDGFICKKPVYRKTPAGREITDILVAVNRAYNKSDYIPAISWGRNARFAKDFDVSNNIKITGRLQSREYQKKVSETEYITRVAYEISVSKLELL